MQWQKVSGVLVVGLLTVIGQQAKSQENKTDATLQVRIQYSGSGTVDENHKIFVVLWDSPGFVNPSTQSSIPLQVLPVSSKNGNVVFTGVSKSPVYVSAAYDPNGQWDGKSGPPPTGSSLGLYSKSPGKPEPINIESGKKASVTISFNDSYKMP